jgi:hypothetical protein
VSVQQTADRCAERLLLAKEAFDFLYKFVARVTFDLIPVVGVFELGDVVGCGVILVD